MANGWVSPDSALYNLYLYLPDQRLKRICANKIVLKESFLDLEALIDGLPDVW